MLKGKHFFDTKNLIHPWTKCWHTILFRILKSILDNGQSTRNNVKHWREIALKNSRVPISTAIKIDF
jgi:hypothetical protein